MSQKTEIVTAVGTLAVALGIGVAMQSSEVAKIRYGAQTPPTMEVFPAADAPVDAKPLVEFQPSEDESPLNVDEIILTSAAITFSPLLVSQKIDPQPASTTQSVQKDLRKEPEYTVRSACPVSATATLVKAAFVNLNVSADCYANEKVIISHEGMQFDSIVSDQGALSVAIPALNQHAEFTVRFQNGKTAWAEVTVFGMSKYNRVAVQSENGSGVQIHAREMGSDYGQVGHVWHGAARDISTFLAGKGGVLTLLGNSGEPDQTTAQVYTFPMAQNGDLSDVALSIETEVLATNCGRDVTARTVRVLGGMTAKTQTLRMSVPACDAVGDYLVLNNPLEDLKLASN